MKFVFVIPVVATGLLMAGGSVSKVASVEAPVHNDGLLFGVKAGTLGVGIDISKKITDDVALRVNVNGFNYKGKRKIKGNNINYNLSLATAGALLDYFPTDSGFRVSGGIYYNGNKLTGYTKAGSTVKINGNTYPTGIKQFDAKISFNNLDPYVGLGWSSFDSDSGWSLDIDLGAMYSGSPKVKFTPTFTAAATPAIKNSVNSDTKKAEADFASKLSKYKVTPVVMVGISYRF